MWSVRIGEGGSRSSGGRGALTGVRFIDVPLDVKCNDCSLHFQQPAAANLCRKSHSQRLNAAAFWLRLYVF